MFRKGLWSLNGDTIDTGGWYKYLVIEYIVSFHKVKKSYRYNKVYVQKIKN